MLHYLQNLFQALDVSSLTDAVLRVAAVFLCLTVHETCHGLAALALGDPTAKSMAPAVPESAAPHRLAGSGANVYGGFRLGQARAGESQLFPQAQAGHGGHGAGGPVSNLLLAILFLGIGKVIYLYAPYSAGMNVFFEWCLFTVAPMSVGMGLFNLIPLPPLDGSKVLAMFLPNSVYEKLMRYEYYGLMLLLILNWLHFGGNIFQKTIYGVYEALFHIFFA